MRLEDSGMFQCVASNEAGDATAYTWLRVKSKMRLTDGSGFFDPNMSGEKEHP